MMGLAYTFNHARRTTGNKVGGRTATYRDVTLGRLLFCESRVCAGRERDVLDVKNLERVKAMRMAE
jgi:hypothetical protein